MRTTLFLSILILSIASSTLSEADVTIGLVTNPETGARGPMPDVFFTLYVVAEPSLGDSLRGLTFEMPAPAARDFGPFYLGSSFNGTDSNPADLVWDIEFQDCISLDGDSLVVLAELQWLIMNPYMNEEMCIRDVGVDVQDARPLEAVDCQEAAFSADLSGVGRVFMTWTSVTVSRGCVNLSPCCDPLASARETWGTIKSRY